MTIKEKYNGWALITGASSGIGEAFARRLAEEEINLIIAARRIDRLQNLAAELSSKYPIDVLPIQVDLTEDNFINVIIREIGNREVSILINNAGIGSPGLFIENNPVDEIEIVKTNCIAPIILTQHFARKMVQRKRGAIIFLGSVVGFLPTPLSTTYSASKAFNIFMGSSLWYELKEHNIAVLALSPGSTRTEFKRLYSVKRGPFLAEPKDVVETALKNLGKKPSIVHGFYNKLLTAGSKLLPLRFLLFASGYISKTHYKKRKK